MKNYIRPTLSIINYSLQSSLCVGDVSDIIPTEKSIFVPKIDKVENALK